jgi:hypothetical protein
MCAKRAGKRTRQGFHEQTLGNFRADQDEHAVAAVFMIAILPRNSCVAECTPHRLVQAITYQYLMAVGSLAVRESLNIDSNYCPMDRPTAIAHLPSRQAR